jgi:hypothetical protein
MICLELKMNVFEVLKSGGNPQTADLEVIWSDPQGNKWRVNVNWTTSQTVGGISGMSIAADGHTTGLTTRLLRHLPLGEIGKIKRDHDLRKGLVFEADSSQKGGHRRVGISDLELKKVGSLYSEAKANEMSTQKYIAAHFGISIPTAARRIGLAKQRGYIKNGANRLTKQKGNTHE